VWVKYVNGEAHFVRAEDMSDNEEVPFEDIRIRSAYHKEGKEIEEKLEDPIDTYRLAEIWPDEE
jgi:hypothetical protein